MTKSKIWKKSCQAKHKPQKNKTVDKYFIYWNYLLEINGTM